MKPRVEFTAIGGAVVSLVCPNYVRAVYRRGARPGSDPEVEYCEAELEVEQMPSGDWTIPASCEHCDKPLDHDQLMHMAEQALDSLDPSDDDLRAAGMIP